MRLRSERVRRKFLLELVNDSSVSRKRRLWAYDQLDKLDKKVPTVANTAAGETPSPAEAGTASVPASPAPSGLALLAAEIDGTEPKPDEPQPAPTPARARHRAPDLSESRARLERQIRGEDDSEPTLGESVRPDSKPEAVRVPEQPVRIPDAPTPAPRGMTFPPLFPRHNRALVADPISELEQARGRCQIIAPPQETEAERRERVARDFAGMNDEQKRQFFGF